MSSYDPYARPDDGFNPYESPKAGLGPPDRYYQTGGASSLPFGIGEVFGRTWEVYKANWGLCVGTAVGCYAMNFVLQQALSLGVTMIGGVSGAMMGGLPGPGPGGGPGPMGGPGNPAQTQVLLMVGVVMFVGGIALAIFQLWIGIGQTIVFLNIAQGREAPFGDVFRGGRCLGSYLLASLFYFFVLGIGVLPGVIPGALAAASGSMDQSTVIGITAIGILAAIGVMSVFAIRLSMYQYLIIDRGAGAFGSLRDSMELTRGRLGGLAGLGILTFLLNVGGFLACGVGLFATIPFTFLLLAVTYQSLAGGPVADPAGMGKPYVSGDPLFEP